MSKFKTLSKFILIAALGAFVLTSCSSDDDSSTTPPESIADPYVVTLAYAPASGYDYSYYTVPFKDIMTGTLSAEGKGVEQVGYFDYKQIENTIYSIGGLNDVKVSTINQQSNGTLQVTSKISFPEALSDMVPTDDGKLVAVAMDSDSDKINFYQIGKSSLSVINQVSKPVSDLVTLTQDEGINFTGMAIDGHNIFISYYISNVNTFATPNTNKATVAVYSYPSFEFKKVITDNRVGPIGGFNLKHGLVEDENGNIYAISHSNPANGYSQFTKPSGILKIDAGTTEFNPNYFFKTGQKGSVTHTVYLGNGRAFAEINVTPRASQKTWSDSMLKSAVINFNSKTIRFINGIPEHHGNGRRLPVLVHNEFVYIPVPEDTGIYFYKINTTDFTAKKGAKVEANFVAGTFKF